MSAGINPLASILGTGNGDSGGSLVHSGPGIITPPDVNPNLLRWTEQFDNAVWGTDPPITITPNNGLSPLGDLTADRIAFGDSGDIYQVSQTVANTGTPHGTSAIPTSTWSRVSVSATFDTGTFVYGLWVCDPLDSGLSFSFSISAVSGFIRVVMFDTGDLASFLAWGAKLEIGSVPTGTAATYGKRTT